VQRLATYHCRYPAGLSSYDFKGLFAYKMFLTIAMIMGEGIYMLGRVIFSGEWGRKHCHDHMRRHVHA
jgi:hypothetical protein